MNTSRTMMLSSLLLLASCAGRGQGQSVLIQPQGVSGPCTVKNFFILNFTAVRAEMAVANAGQGCTFVVFNPAQQVFVTAALITDPPAHGSAQAGLAGGGFQGAATYTPEPGYTGPDHFTATFEPQDRAVSVAVMVQSAVP